MVRGGEGKKGKGRRGERGVYSQQYFSSVGASETHRHTGVQ